jgi:hypothetical protein
MLMNAHKVALGLLRRAAVYTWDSVTANSSDSALLAGQDSVVAVYDGASYLYCGKSAGVWKLLWTDRSGALLRGDTAGATPVTLASGASAGPFAAAYGLATTRLAGEVAKGTMFSHPSDCLIEYIATALANTLIIGFRRPDPGSTSNEWRAHITESGQMSLFERVDDSNTIRGSVGIGSVADGDRITIVADGHTIDVHSANTLQITYADAVNFATATTGIVNPTNGVISDLIAWPRHLTGMAAAALEAV